MDDPNNLSGFIRRERNLPVNPPQRPTGYHLLGWCHSNVKMLQKFSYLEKTNRQKYLKIVSLIMSADPQDIDF